MFKNKGAIVWFEQEIKFFNPYTCHILYDDNGYKNNLIRHSLKNIQEENKFKRMQSLFFFNGELAVRS